MTSNIISASRWDDPRYHQDREGVLVHRDRGSKSLVGFLLPVTPVVEILAEVVNASRI
jgi:hypothetical protein